ncbi:protein Wiz-like isoform X2 [Myxocyprinus asiaticus]|uniref:protein Wiz-like isoform X2 n=1 Tax=Myxocyprinus asiaticus TaxID=70543 RepID=UPI0022219250|nr:protein Wiz-like isoform X2 [Myxocyprinus asiaticus]
MEPSDDLSTRDPQDLMSNQGALSSTSNPILNCTLSGGLLQSGVVEKGDGNSENPKGFFPTLEQCGKTQRSPRSPAFNSSLTWDSDSEKETLEEEELQHFSNPHGLAAHSPGSPTSGQTQDRLDIDVCQEPEESKHLFLKKITPGPIEIENPGDVVTYREPTTTDSSSQKLEQDKVTHLPDIVPEEGCQKEEQDDLKVHNQRGKEKMNTKETDVYSFPADSEPESPPPGPWAHCTFIQRRRKKRAILRPFSGLGTWQRPTGGGRRGRGKTSGAKKHRKTTEDKGRMSVFKDVKEEKVQERQRSIVDHQLDGDLYQAIFTCVECSIYFKKQAHLREHMQEHGHGKGPAKKWGGQHTESGFECVECGQEFVDRLLLLDHRRRHKESRRKILEEIGKLNEGGKSTAKQASCSKESESVIKESAEVSCGQFVCLKCNFSSDVPQEFADHKKTHSTRTRAGVSRSSPRIQHKSSKKGQVSTADVPSTLVTSPLNKRYPIRASKKTKETQLDAGPLQVDTSSGISQNTPASATPGEATDQPYKATLLANTVLVEESSQIGEPKTTVANPVEENVLQPQCLMSTPPNPRAGPRRRDVAFKSIGKKRKTRVERDKLGRTRASTRLDPKSTQTQGVKKRVQISNQTEVKTQREGTQTAEPEHEPKQGSKTGGGEEEDEDEEEEEARMPLTEKSGTNPRKKTLFSLQEHSPESKETDSLGSNLLKCEICGTSFETRRGLSSHARSHLRQLGIGMSENSGAPIDLLYQITKERAMDAHFTGTPPSVASPKKLEHHSPPVSMPSPKKDIETEKGLLDTKPTVPYSVVGSVNKVSSSPNTSSVTGSLPSSPFIKSRSPSPVLRKAPISSLLPVSSPLRSQEHKTLGKNQAANLSSPSKPFWAPQETDAPLNLTMDLDSKDIICQLCGAWFETRKGLSSHARAHLRHFRIEYSESKGSPIDLLNRFILTDEFKHRANSFLSDGPEDLRSPKTSMASLLPSTSTASSKRPPPSSPILHKTAPLRTTIGSKATSPSTHTLLGPPTKKLKPSSLQVLRFSGGDVMPFPIEPMKEVNCEFCGELFENRKGLSSHARSHLRQLGITEWSVNGSPIDTLREIIVRRGLPSIVPLKTHKSPSSSPGPGLPRSTLQCSSPPGNVLVRLPFHFPQSPSHDQPTNRKKSPSTSTASSSPTVEMVKPKPEPEIVEVTMKGSEMGVSASYSPEPLHPSLSSSDKVFPVNLVMTQEKEPSRDIRCDFCGEFFENRKGLSSHARSHLRHMGITEWSVNGSPIDTLWEVMRRQGTVPASAALGIKEEPGQDGRLSLNSPGYQSHVLSRKSPLNLLHSGSRLHKHGLGSMGLSRTSPVGKFFGVVPLRKKVLVEDEQPGEKSLLVQSKSFSPPPQDHSIKGKVSTEKQGVGHMDASCELCGFYFENRKALASHARAHLRQFGVTEWCVNGSPIETLSAWIRSRPQKAAEMQQSYAQGGRYVQKKRCSSSLSPSHESDPTASVCHKLPVAKWASLTLPQKRAVGRDVNSCSLGLSSRAPEAKIRNESSNQHGLIQQSDGHHSSNTLSHVQVAHSELNVRLPRVFERRPLKHPSHAEGGERESGPPKPRSSTVPALVPKPPSTPLVRLVGKIYSLKCRFCDVEFHGPLSVQEDWIRHLQQHILNLNYKKTSPPANDTPAQCDTSVPKPPSSATTSITTTARTTTPSTLSPKAPTTPTPTPASTPTRTPIQVSTAPHMAGPVTPATAEPLPSLTN